MTILIQEQIAHEQTKVELYKAQFQILDMMGRASMAKIETLRAQVQAAETQAKFDAAVDARDEPCGATKPPDEYAGS